MATHLRKLALTVDQVDPGEFFWRILEGHLEDEKYPREIDAAAQPFATYMDALKAGYDALATLAQENPEHGPQAALHAPPAEEGGVIERAGTYRGHPMVAQCTRTRAGGFVPGVRVKGVALVLPEGGEGAWYSPKVAYPRGGYVDMEAAFAAAFAAARKAADGIFEDEALESLDFELAEGGPELKRPLRDLGLFFSEDAALRFHWQIAEFAADHSSQLVAKNTTAQASFIDALRAASHALLALGASNEDGPRQRDCYRKEICYDAVLVPQGEAR